MRVSKKIIYNILWILIAYFIGAGISFAIIKGGDITYKKIQNFINEEFLVKKLVATNEQANVQAYDLQTINEFKPEINTEKQQTVSMGFVGDIIPGNNPSPELFSNVTFYTEKPDIMIGNFEGVLASNTYQKCKPESSKCYSFNGDDLFLDLISKASFDVLNIANNHFNDYGIDGQKETLAKIKDVGITPVGIKNEISYIMKNGLIVGIVGFSNYEWTIDLNNTEAVQKIIQEAEDKADIVIAIFHGGGEGAESIHTPNGIENYLGENRGNLRAFAYNAVDSGADIILGSGPHVLRGIEKYKDKLIAYSLGNFASSNRTSTQGLMKISAMLEVTLNKNGDFVSGNIYPLEINSSGIPSFDLKNKGITMFNYLSQKDFGRNRVEISENGLIVFK